ncbi:magnesium transporter CorA family protein [Patescibacteria group bacterium]|nr:magnesium transporter CorA family protein [Patescibacteria group bacterium]
MSLFKQIFKNIQQITIDNPKTKNKLIWLNICDAGKEEVKYLRKKYDFKLAHLQASLAKTIAQRAAVEQCDDYLFIILHFPIFNNNNIVSAEIEFFISHELLITIHNNNIPTLNDFFNTCKKESDTTLAYKHESSAVLLYEILEKLLLNCYHLLDENSIAINKSEETIFAREQKKAVSQILSLRHSIINLRKIIQNHKNIIEKLIQMKSSIVPAKQIKEYYNKLVEHSKNIWEILENKKETIEALNNTNESLLNDKISNIMKTLTIFSVIMFPLTFFAGLFGMNVASGMPFINTVNGFWLIVFIMTVGALLMLLFFEKKKWL